MELAFCLPMQLRYIVGVVTVAFIGVSFSAQAEQRVHNGAKGTPSRSEVPASPSSPPPSDVRTNGALSSPFQSAAQKKSCWDTPLAQDKTIFIFNGRGLTINEETEKLAALFRKVTSKVVVVDIGSPVPKKIEGEYFVFVAAHGIPTFEKLDDALSDIKEHFDSPTWTNHPDERTKALQTLAECKKAGIGHCVLALDKSAELKSMQTGAVPSDVFIPTAPLLELLLSKQDPARAKLIKSGSCFSSAACEDVEKKFPKVPFIASSARDQFSYSTHVSDSSGAVDDDTEITNYFLAGILTNSAAAKMVDQNEDCCIDQSELSEYFDWLIQQQKNGDLQRAQKPTIPKDFKLCAEKTNQQLAKASAPKEMMK
jgi:hypothetical protein